MVGRNANAREKGRRRARLLLVDDERPFLDALTERLRSRDFEVASCESGVEALRLLDEDGAADVAVVDMAMPGMDGLETLREIKRRFPLMAVILLTGQGGITDGIEGMKLGAFDYLEKPCDLEELAAKARQALAARRRRPQQAAPQT